MSMQDIFDLRKQQQKIEECINNIITNNYTLNIEEKILEPINKRLNNIEQLLTDAINILNNITITKSSIQNNSIDDKPDDDNIYISDIDESQFGDSNIKINSDIQDL